MRHSYWPGPTLPWSELLSLAHHAEQHCRNEGREPGEIQRSAQALVFLSDDREFIDRIKARENRMPTIAGDVDEIREIIKAYAAAGVDEFIVPDFNLGPRERKVPILDRFIKEVAPVAR